MNNTLKFIATGLIGLSTLDYQAITMALKKAATHVAPVAKPATLTIRVTGFRNDKGGAGFALYNSKTGYDKDKGFREELARISNRTAMITLRDIPVGVYAAAFHDENGNQKLDENRLGVPTEGVGLSNNPKISITNIPTFDKIKFTVIEGEQTIEFKIQY